MKKQWYLIIVLLMITSCAKKRYSCTPDSNVLPTDDTENSQFQEYVAQLIDIPIPLLITDKKVITRAENYENEIALQFKTVQSVPEIITFYTYEMEKAGWNLEYSMNAHTALFIFEKPYRWCGLLISASPDKQEKKVIIMHAFKNKYNED